MNYFICVCFSELTDTISSFRIQILSNLTLTLTTKMICLITNTFVDYNRNNDHSKVIKVWGPQLSGKTLQQHTQGLRSSPQHWRKKKRIKSYQKYPMLPPYSQETSWQHREPGWWVYILTYLSPKNFFQNSAASAFVIRKLSPWNWPLGKIALISASMWLKIRDNLVRFRLYKGRVKRGKYMHVTFNGNLY